MKYQYQSTDVTSLIFLFSPYGRRSLDRTNDLNSSWEHARFMKGCRKSESADMRRSGLGSRQSARKSAKCCDHRSGCLRVAGSLMVIKSRARRGGSFRNGGSPCAISRAVIPRLQMSTCK
jgi:hypothetical protein